jgi:hypothetical protein
LARRAEDAFLDSDGDPILRRSAVLFIDLLGVREMAVGPDAASYLVELEAALKRPVGDFLAEDSPWPAAFFSDTLVMVSPVEGPMDVDSALMGLAVQASWVQVNLAASAGMFLRGALTMGDVYLREGLLFGPALVEAYDLERLRAVNPRIVLSDDAVAAMRHEMEQYGPEEGAYLREEQDGTIFIDYLDILLDDLDPVPSIERHRDVVRAKLDAHTGDSGRWEKYRWVAEYHDAYCREQLPDMPALLINSDGHGRAFRRFTVKLQR